MDPDQPLPTAFNACQDWLDNVEFDCTKLRLSIEHVERDVLCTVMLAGVQDASHPYCSFLNKVAALAPRLQATTVLTRGVHSSPIPSVHLFYWLCIMFLLSVAEVFPALRPSRRRFYQPLVSSIPCEPPMRPFPLFSLPIELVQLVFSFIPKRELISLSIEELLGPRSEVQWLSLRRITYGYMIVPYTSTPPTEADLLHIDYWRSRQELDSPDALRIQHRMCTHSRMDHDLHDQLFMTPSAHAEIALFVWPGCTFPLAMRCNRLEELDIIMGDLLWCVLWDIWQCTATMLTSLLISIPYQTEYAFARTIDLSSLLHLRILTLTAFLPNVPVLLNTAGTWSSQNRGSPDTKLTLIVNMTSVHVGRLALTLRLSHLLRFFLPSQSNSDIAFRGDFTLVLKAHRPVSNQSDKNHADQLIQALVANSQVAAVVHPWVDGMQPVLD
ncbi:hypothetical protein EV421DRAFT_1908340 [Armillaria borealis]|uniref:F-box domain-containing protein n=1 Tax=Armillaria borealis TaxID=47425 RepID=A0AA39MJD1_9AGAR|nr:hypothetical protein EV421DRAFT_1908340 [Armillaria borealis]